MVLKNDFPTSRDNRDDASTVRLLIQGRVQGVGFRFFVFQAAQKLNLVGWVRNLPDGTVEAEAQGPRRILERWIDGLRSGPPLSRVDHIQSQWGPATEKYPVFEIRP